VPAATVGGARLGLLLGLDGGPPVGGAALAIGFVEQQLARSQWRQRGTAPLPHGDDAIGDRKSPLAVGLLLGKPLLQRLPLGGDARPLVVAGRDEQRQAGDADPRMRTAVRSARCRHRGRASARNSTDCISCSLDTVRGNSCPAPLRCRAPAAPPPPTR